MGMDKFKLTEEVINSYWFKAMEEPTIHDAAICMVLGINPEVHEENCEEDTRYNESYCDHPLGDEYVMLICSRIIRDIKKGKIKYNGDVNIDINTTTIIKLSWLEWCRKKGYIEKIHLTSQPDVIDIESENINTPTNAATTDSKPAPPNTSNAEDNLSKFFDPVTVAALEKMFPAGEKWKGWAERAKRNGLIDSRESRAKFNPYKASIWFLQQNIAGYDLAKCLRTLGKNLPDRSKYEKYLFEDKY